MQEMFFEGFKSNTLSSNNYKAVYGSNIGSSSSGSTNKSSSKDFDDKNGHWVTVNHKHIFIEDEKGGKKSKGSSSKTSSNKSANSQSKSTNPNKMKGKPTGGAASITKEKKEKEKKKISLFDRRKDKKEDKKSEKNEDKRPYSAEYKLTEEEMKAYKNSDDELSDKLYPISNLIKKEEEKNFESIETKIKNKELQNTMAKNNNSYNFIKPVEGKITSNFGYRPAPTKGASTGHSGIDIAVPIGTPIKAIADGKVIAVGPANKYGKWVLIDHGEINGVRVTSEYGHISSWEVHVGQEIKQGDIIAKSGNEGVSTGPHLHFTIKENGIPKDPLNYIKGF